MLASLKGSERSYHVDSFVVFFFFFFTPIWFSMSGPPWKQHCHKLYFMSVSFVCLLEMCLFWRWTLTCHQPRSYWPDVHTLNSHGNPLHQSISLFFWMKWIISFWTTNKYEMRCYELWCGLKPGFLKVHSNNPGAICLQGLEDDC